jgi:hypothetical protein
MVRSERTLFESTAPEPPAGPPQWLHWYLLLGLALGGTAVSLGAAARRGGSARVALGVLIGIWGLAVGLAGTTLAGLWGLTDHVMAYRNENLFQANPLALALVVLGPVALAGRSARWARIGRGVATSLAVLALAGWILQVLPTMNQVNGPIIALALPVHLGIAAALRRAS